MGVAAGLGLPGMDDRFGYLPHDENHVYVTLEDNSDGYVMRIEVNYMHDDVNNQIIAGMIELFKETSPFPFVTNRDSPGRVRH